MVQVIAAPTSRQQALLEAIGQASTAGVSAYQKEQATQRQQALLDAKYNQQDVKNEGTLAAGFIKQGASPAVAMGLAKELLGNYTPVQTAPAQDAQPAVQAQPTVAPIAFSPAVPARPEIPAIPMSDSILGSRVPAQAAQAEIAAQPGSLAIQGRPAIQAIPAQYAAKPSETFPSFQKQQRDVRAAKDKEIADQKAAMEQHRQTSEYLATGRFNLAQQNADKSQSAADTKATVQSQKDLDSFTKQYDPYQASARSPIGQEVKRFQQSVHTLNLIKGVDDLNNLSEMKKREIAISLATMLSPTGVPHESDIAMLDPHTINSFFASKLQYMTNRPAPTNSAEMVRQLKESLINQQGVSMSTIKDYQDTILESHADKIASNPDKYQKIIEKADISKKLQGTGASENKQSIVNQATGQPHPQVRQGDTIYNWNPSTNKYEAQ